MLTWEIFEVMTAAEAEENWNLGKGTVRVYCNSGKFHESEARKSAGVWLVSNVGMVRVFGESKRKRA